MQIFLHGSARRGRRGAEVGGNAGLLGDMLFAGLDVELAGGWVDDLAAEDVVAGSGGGWLLCYLGSLIDS